jgi:hypothetical protein
MAFEWQTPTQNSGLIYYHILCGELTGPLLSSLWLFENTRVFYMCQRYFISLIAYSGSAQYEEVLKAETILATAEFLEATQ